MLLPVAYSVLSNCYLADSQNSVVQIQLRDQTHPCLISEHPSRTQRQRFKHKHTHADKFSPLDDYKITASA